MKRAFIIHGWDGTPQEGWLPWLKRELEARGFYVEVPRMPDTHAPKIEVWVPHLAGLVGDPDGETYFIGHSIGVQTILRYLETVDAHVGGVVAVAGFFTLITGSIGGPEEEAIAQPWLTRPMNLEKIKKNAGRVVAVFSDNDRFVDLENVAMFQERLGAKMHILHNKGHIDENAGVREVPEILEAIVEISGSSISKTL